MDKCLIFEGGCGGHRLEYICHLMKYINGDPDLDGKFIFVLDERMRASVYPLAILDRFELLFSNFNKRHRNSIVRSFWEWDKLELILLRRNDIKEILFMELDPYLFLISTKKFKKFELSIKGILFQPYIHLKRSRVQLKYILNGFIKNFVIQRFAFLANNKLKKCFILNDTEGVEMLNNKIKDIFYFLPDPIEDNIPRVDAEIEKVIAAKFNLDKAKRLLLLFGQIDSRKNLINVIDALGLFSKEKRSSICLIVAGKFNDKVRKVYIDHIDKARLKLEIIYNDDFVSEEEREVLFAMCDVVLMPYINYFSSSGVMGHAIRHTKRVIVSSTGLLKKLVSANSFGLCVDPYNVKGINNALNELLFGQISIEYNNKKFLKQHKPWEFGHIILKVQ